MDLQCEAFNLIVVYAVDTIVFFPKQKCFSVDRLLLNIGSIRIYILTTGVVSNETNTYVRMYIEEFYSSRDLDTLELNIELNKHWKNAALYTLATKDWLL